MREQLQRRLGIGETLERFDRPQQPARIVGVGDRGPVDGLGCDQRAAKVRRHIALCAGRGDGIAEYLAACAAQPLGCLIPALNLAYLGLVETLYGYPLDGVVLTIGCDKTTPALLMAAATVDIPAIALSVGPMLNGFYRGERTGSGTIIWKARELLAKGDIDYESFVELDRRPRSAIATPWARPRP